MIATILGLPRWVQGFGLIALAVAAFLIWDHFDDRAAVKAADAKREAAAQPARDEAADQRTKDATTNSKTEEDLHDAIDSAPTGGSLSPAARSLACRRLRNLGRIPASCRSEGGD
jgi:hypothetical protein